MNKEFRRYLLYVLILLLGVYGSLLYINVVDAFYVYNEAYMYYQTDPSSQQYTLDVFSRPGGGYYARKYNGIYAYDKDGNELWKWQWGSYALYLSAHIYDSSRVWVVWYVPSSDRLYVGIVKDGSLLSSIYFTVTIADVQVLYRQVGFLNPVYSQVALLYTPWGNEPVLYGSVAVISYDGTNNVRVLWQKSRSSIYVAGKYYSPAAISKEAGIYIGDKDYFYMLGISTANYDSSDRVYEYHVAIIKVNFNTGYMDQVSNSYFYLTYPYATYFSSKILIQRVRMSRIGPSPVSGYTQGVAILTSEHVYNSAGNMRGSVSVLFGPLYGSRLGLRLVSYAGGDPVYIDYEGDKFVAIYKGSNDSPGGVFVGMYDPHHNVDVSVFPFRAERDTYIPPWYVAIRVVKDSTHYTLYRVFTGNAVKSYMLKIYKSIPPMSTDINKFQKATYNCYRVYTNPSKGITSYLTIGNLMKFATVTIKSDMGEDYIHAYTHNATVTYELWPDKVKGNLSLIERITRAPDYFEMSFPAGYSQLNLGCINYTDVGGSLNILANLKTEAQAVGDYRTDITINYHLPTTATVDIVIKNSKSATVFEEKNIPLPTGQGSKVVNAHLAGYEDKYVVEGYLHLPGYPAVEKLRERYIYRINMFDPQLSIAQAEIDFDILSIDVYAHDGTTSFYDISSGTPKLLRTVNLYGNADHKYTVAVPLAGVGEYKIVAKTEQYGIESNFSNVVKVVRLPKSPKILSVDSSRDKDGNIEVSVAVYEKGVLKLTIGDTTLFEGVKDKGSHTFTHTLSQYGKYDIKATLSVNGYTSKEAHSQVEYVPPTPTIKAPQTTTVPDVSIQVDAIAGTLKVYVDGGLYKTINHSGGMAEITVHLGSKGLHTIEVAVEVNGAISDKARAQIMYGSGVPAPQIQVTPTVEGPTATVVVNMPVDGTLYMALGGHDLGASQLTKGRHEITISIPGIGKHTLQAYIESGGAQSDVVKVYITRIPMPPALNTPTSTYKRSLSISMTAEDSGTLEIAVDGAVQAYQVSGGDNTITLKLTRGIHVLKARLCVRGYCSRYSIYKIRVYDLIEIWIDKKNYSVNGHAGAMDVAPFIDPTVNRTMVPLRFILEGLGFEVKWRGDTRTIEITGLVYHEDGTTEQRKVYMHMPKAKPEMHGKYKVYPGSSLVKVEKADGSMVTIDMKNYNGQNMGIPFIYQNRTFVPIRFISEIFGATVKWNGKERKVTINR